MYICIMKQIPDLPNYFIDENFDVWSKSYHPKTNKNCELRKLKPNLHHRGYLTLNIYNNGKKKQYRIHQLIAMTFISNPNNYPCVLHNDGNQLNNHPNNLRWGTQKMNAEDRRIHGTHGNTKLTDQEVLEIREKYIPRKYSIYKLAKEYNVTFGLISQIINNKIWTHN